MVLALLLGAETAQAQTGPVVTISRERGIMPGIVQAETATEGETIRFMISVSPPSSSILVINMRRSGGADFGIDDGRDTIGTNPPGRSDYAFAYDSRDDAFGKANKDFTVTVVAGTGYRVGEPASATVTIVDNDRPAPLAPGNLRAVADGLSAIDLSWTAPATAATRAAVTGYRIEASADGNTGWSQVGTTDAATTTWEHGSLAAGTTRHYRVIATSSSGDSAPSTTASATTESTGTGSLGTPLFPRRLSASADGRTAIVLSWMAPEASESRAAVTGYRIEASADGNTGWSQVGTTNAATTTFRHTGLTAGTTRHYRVIATSTAGDSDPSATEPATTPNPPSAPTGLTNVVTDETHSQVFITLSWTAPTAGGGRAAVTGYRIEQADGSDWNQVGTTNATTTTFMHRNLTAGTTYRYRVIATSSEGDSPPSNVRSVTTLAGTRPSPPTRLSATADGRTAVDLTWQAPLPYALEAAPTGYRIEATAVAPPPAEDGTGWRQVGTTDADTTTFKHTGLTAGTTRYYRVFARSSVGDSLSSPTASATTDPPPSAPSFGTQTIRDQTYREGTSITTLVLPQATAGDGTIIYELDGLPTGTGLSFNAANRRLTGTPTAADRGASPFTLTYTAADSDENTAATDEASLTFDVTVNTAATGPAITAIGLEQPPGTGAGQWYNTGDRIRINVEFDLAIGPATTSATANKATATPNLRMVIGATERTVADCFRLGRSGNHNALRCRYTVVEADRDPDGVSFPADALALPAGVELYARDDTATAAVITFGAVSNIAAGRVNAGSGARTPPDTAPSFSQTIPDQTYREGTAITTLQLPQATGGNGTITYTLTGLPATTGLRFSASNRRLTGTPSAADQGASPITVTYTAADSDTNRTGTDTAVLRFQVTVNAADTPTFTGTPYSFTLAENADGSTTPVTVGTVTATSVAGAGTAAYSITAGDTGSVFAIGSADGAITYTGGGEDHESFADATSAFTLTVRATDNNGSTDETVTVAVTDVNEPPAFTTPDPSNAASLAFSGVEGSFTGRQVTPLVAEDPDTADSVAYTLTGADAGDFEVLDAGGGTYVLYFRSQPDFENPADAGTNNVYEVTVTATGGAAGRAMTAAVNLTVTVTNADEAPSFGTQTILNQTYREGAAITALVLPAVTDAGDGTVTYTLTGLPASTGLSFAAATRTLSGTPAAADVTASPFTLTYTASDGDSNTAAADRASLTFEVSVNSATAGPAITAIGLEMPPGTSDYYVTGGNIEVNVTFDAAIGPASSSPNLSMTVGTTTREVTNCSRDSVQTSVLRCTYTVVSEDEDRDGVSFPRNALSLPSGVVLYTDGDATMAAVITFGPVSNIAAGRVNATPDFGTASIPDQSYTVGRAIPALSLPVAAGGAPPITYTLTGPGGAVLSHDGLSFTLPSTGTPGSLRGTPTAALARTQFTLTATDNRGASDTLTFHVTVNATQTPPPPPPPPPPAANNAPVFGASSYDFELEENADGSATPVAVGAVSATDADDDDLTYSITTGNTDSVFAIDGDGAITYTGSGEDYESFTDPESAFRLTVRASDGTDSADVTVTVAVTEADAGAVTVALSTSADKVVEGGTVTITATASRTAGANTEVVVLRDPASTAGDDDFSLAPPLITIMAGDAEGSLTLTAADDDDVEGDESLTLNGTVGDTPAGSVTLVITDDDVDITYTLSGPEDMNLVEGGSALLTATASAAVPVDTEVMIERDAASTAGEADYAAEPIMIEAGETTGTTLVTAVEDDEPDSGAGSPEVLTLYGVVDGMQTNSVSFHLWDAAVPALPLGGALLLAALLLRRGAVRARGGSGRLSSGR